MKHDSEVKAGGRRLTPSGIRLIVTITVAGCAGFLLTFAKPVAPLAPVLALDPEAVQRVLDADGEGAAAAPDTPAAEAVWELYRAAGRAEAGVESAAHYEARVAATQRAVAALEAEDSAALDRLRGKALVELEQALEGTAEADEATVLGSFPATTERYGVFADGAPVAPFFVVRTLFAGRWNAIMGRELTDGMSPVEQRAYWGWLAVEAGEVPDPLRTRAHEALQEVAPDLVRRVAAFAAFEGDRAAEAVALYGQGDTLRDRNFALGAATVMP